MATAKEESTLEKVERELTEFITKRNEVEASLKAELAKAESEYNGLVKDIKGKYNVDELNEEIKRHTYFSKLLKGEVAFPEDMNAKKEKTRIEDWSGKIAAALSKLGKTVADKPAPKEILAQLKTLNPKLNFESGAFNAAWNKYKKDTK